MVCMTLYFLSQETIVYADVSFLIFFDDVVKHGISVVDGPDPGWTTRGIIIWL